MRFNILSDSDWEARLEGALHALSDLGYRNYFMDKDYGDGLLGVTVVFMCQDPDLSLKRRVRHSKKEKKIYMDIMLDLPEMKAATPEARKRLVVERLLSEVPEVVLKYKIKDFDTAHFIADFQEWMSATGWA
jgi:hypothetical protein